MEERMVKFYSQENNNLALHAIPGHFATSHSHINYYIDVTSIDVYKRQFLACLADLYDIAAMYGSSAAVSEFRDFL